MSDFDRPLTSRGRREAEAAGQFLVENELLPGRILCSAARRTKETLQHAGASMLGFEDMVSFPDSLYSADSAGYLDIVRSVGDADTVLVIGHNPAIGDFARMLAGSGDGTGRARLAAGFPTAAIAVIETGDGFAALAAGTGTLSAFWTPR